MKRIKIDPKAFNNPEIDSLISSELTSLKNDPIVYPVIQNDLKLTSAEAKKNIAALLDFQEDANYCANCPGLGNCDKLHPHFQLHLQRDGEYIVRHYDPCEKMLSLASFRQRYIRCSFPEDWRDASLKTIEKSKASRKESLLAMAGIAKGEDRWLFLNGRAGSGKTYMLACLANYITSKGKRGAFVDTGSLLNELKEKSISDHEGFEALIQELSSASILVFDDFGNEYKTEYVYTNILYPILNNREKAGLPTAFASDFTITQIASMYKPKIGDVRAEQLSELLKRKCRKEYDVTSINFH